MPPARFEQPRAEPAPGVGGPAGLREQRLAGWLQAAAAGDAQAFEQFYDATVACARALGRRFLRDAELDDVLAECYFQAWREAARFDPDRGCALGWLLTLLRSRAVDLLRQRARAGQPLPGDAEAELAALANPLPGPDELLALAEAGSRLQLALAELSAPERWVLGLAYFRELPHAGIAEATGLPLGTVKSLLLRAQHKLRALLAGP